MKNVTGKELAEMLGVSSRRVQQLAEAKVLVKAKRDDYPVTENIHAFIAFKIQERVKELSNFETQELRLKKAQADIAEHKLAEMTGRFVDADVVHEAYRDQVLKMREKLLQLPRRLSLLSLPPEPRSREILLRRELNDALLEISKAGKKSTDDELPDTDADQEECGTAVS